MTSRGVGIVGIVVVGIVAAVVVSIAVAEFAWRRASARQIALLIGQSASTGAAQTWSRAASHDLPVPVARYFAFALSEGQHQIREAHIRWNGQMALRPDAWSDFTADQQFSASSPGFVWDASVHMIPLMPVLVRDSYIARFGGMVGRIGGLLTIVNSQGSHEIAQSALARWLGEAAWFPTALLPGGAVSWSPIDDNTARATLRDGDITVSAEFHFAPTGEMTRMTTMRYREVNGTHVLTPFEGHYFDFERRAGMMVPTRAEVAWLLPSGPYAYWRASPASVAYEF